jgi:hypothetical protein
MAATTLTVGGLFRQSPRTDAEIEPASEPITVVPMAAYNLRHAELHIRIVTFSACVFFVDA